jgi:hypothetical protein
LRLIVRDHSPLGLFVLNATIEIVHDTNRTG